LKYIKPNSRIWCPFDTDRSWFVKVFKKFGHTIEYSHLELGEDFFEIEKKCDYIISNPPYSKKGEVFDRLFNLRIPFAMLVGVVGLFESQKDFLCLVIMNLKLCTSIRELLISRTMRNKPQA